MEKFNGPLKPGLKRCLVSATGSPFPPDFMADPMPSATEDPRAHRIPGLPTIIPQAKYSCVASDRFAAIAIGSEAPALPRL